MSLTERIARTPWERIMRAAERGTCLRLTREEVWRLSQDDAISTRAVLDAEERENDYEPD